MWNFITEHPIITIIIVVILIFGYFYIESLYASRRLRKNAKPLTPEVLRDLIESKQELVIDLVKYDEHWKAPSGYRMLLNGYGITEFNSVAYDEPHMYYRLFNKITAEQFIKLNLQDASSLLGHVEYQYRMMRKHISNIESKNSFLSNSGFVFGLNSEILFHEYTTETKFYNDIL